MRKIELPMRYCIICNKSIIRNTKYGESRISTTQYKKAKFCSPKCKGKWWSKTNTGKNNANYRGGKTICSDCDKPLAARYSYRKTIRCRKCWYSFLRNNPQIHPSWKGGKMVDKSGYILIFKPKHPFSNKLGYIRKHRLIAEKILGRYLTKQEVIHHINKIKDDNRPENLYLFPNGSEHRKNDNNKELKSNLLFV